MSMWIPSNLDEIKGLPDDFEYEFYLNLSNERDLRKWAYQFAIRQETKAKGITHIISSNQKKAYKEGFAHWVDGVYKVNEHGVRAISGYIDAYTNKYLEKSNALQIKDEVYNPSELNVNLLNEFESEVIEKNICSAVDAQNLWNMKYAPRLKKSEIAKQYPIETNVYNPNGAGKTYFKSTGDKDLFIESIEPIKNLASFLVNLEMPTAKIMSQIESAINELKTNRKIKETDFNKYNKFDTWAIGLACFDLKMMGVKPSQIKRKFLSYCYDGYQKKAKAEEGFDLTEDTLFEDDNTRYKRIIENTKNLINGGWKKLIGQPF